MDKSCTTVEPLRLQPSDLSDSAFFLRGLASATQALMTVDRLDAAIRQALGCLGQATQVDRVYLCPLVPGSEPQDSSFGQAWGCQAWGWVSDDLELEPGQLWHLGLASPSLPSRWMEELGAGRSIHGEVENFPSSERPLLEAQGIQSILVLPVQVQQQFWGFVGFEHCSRTDGWTLTEVSVLWAIAACFGGAIARWREQQRLQASNQSLQAQLEEALSPGAGRVAEQLVSGEQR